MSTRAVLSDIHGNIPALEAVVADMAARRVDTVVNLGDHCSGPLWPRETIEFLMQQSWIHILGNMDRSVAFREPSALGLSDAYAFGVLNDEQKEWLRALPANATLDNVFMFHGTPVSDSEYLLETVEHGRGRLASQTEIQQRVGTTRSPVMLCGHSHVQRVVDLGDKVVIVNPGSVGLPAFQDDLPEPHVIESGSPHARYAVIEPGPKQCSVEFISVPYDFSKSGRSSEKRQSPRLGNCSSDGLYETVVFY